MNALTPPLGLKNIPDFIEMRLFRNAKEFPYSGLWLFSGAQGHGKTLLAMSLIRSIVKEYPEVVVVSNISIYGIPSIPYEGIADFERYNNGEKGIIFLIDEIQTLFNSLESAKMPLSTVQVWSQNRKNRRVIFGTSQRFNRVAKEIREQTHTLYALKRPLLCFHRFHIYDGSEFDDRGNYTGDRVPIHIFVPGFKDLTSYNTLQTVCRESLLKGVEKL